jgi:hypothetical protein
MKATSFLLPLITFNVAAQDALDPWQALAKAERKATYDIVLGDRSCRWDRINEVNSDAIKVGSGIIPRSELLFVGQNLHEHDVVYDGRNCWSSLMDAKAAKPEGLRVLLKSGQELSGSELAASDEALSLKRLGKTTVIAKKDIVQVDYIRFKPLSDAHKYTLQELAWAGVFDPKLWQYWLKLDAFMSVRIYDSRLPEDCTPLPLTCSK